jgi:hypothetical protein
MIVSNVVMAGLDPAIHWQRKQVLTWMAASRLR